MMCTTSSTSQSPKTRAIQKKPSGLSQFASLLSKDLRREIRSKEMLVSMLLYAILVIVVYGIALGFTESSDDYLDILGGLLWAMIVFTSLLGLGKSFAQENENDCIEGILLTPIDRGAIFLSKAASNLLFLLMIELIAVPIFWLFFSGLCELPQNGILLVAPLLLGSIGIAGIGTLLSTITAGTRNNNVMLALLFVPMVFPLLYACISATQLILGGANLIEASTSLAISFGYDIIMILLSWILYQYVVESR